MRRGLTALLLIACSVFIIGTPTLVGATEHATGGTIRQTPGRINPDAERGLVPCGTLTDADSGKIANPCKFSDFLILANRIINLAILISAALAAIAFAYAGFLYTTAAGSMEQIKKAHEVFKNVAIGFIIVLSAWLIVYTIVQTLVPDAEEFTLQETPQ